MFNFLVPDQYYPDIFSIDLDKLKQNEIRGIICDIDNTIVPWDQREVFQEVINWFRELETKGFEICLISNGRKDRVQFFSRELGIPAIGQAVKPTVRSYRKALKILGLEKHQIAVVGDQLFTDIWGGNRMGFTTILVDPMGDREFITTSISRFVEKLFFKREN